MRITDIIEARRGRNRRPPPSTTPTTPTTPPAPTPAVDPVWEKYKTTGALLASWGLEKVAGFQEIHASKVRTLQAAAIWLRWLQIWGYGEVIVEYYDKKASLEFAHEKLATDDPKYLNDAALEYWIRILREETLAKILASVALFTVAKWIFRLVKGGRLTMLLAGIASGTASFGVGTIAALTAYFGTEVGMIALQAYLSSPAGEKAISYFVFWCVDPAWRVAYERGPQQILAFFRNTHPDEQKIATDPRNSTTQSDKKDDATNSDGKQAQQPEKPASSSQERSDYDKFLDTLK